MTHPTDFSRPRPLIEPLESRIAPALLVNGANLLGGAGNPATGETSIGGNSVTLVTVLSGNAIVWFDHGSIDAISVGPNTALNITGNVGAIIGNLTASGRLSDSDNNPANGLDGGVLLQNNILSITTHPLSNQLGSIGEIITGGSISNLNISGNLTGVYAGNGAFQAGSVISAGGTGSVVIPTGLDLNPILPGVQNNFVFAASNAKTVSSGASIMNVTMGAAEELQMFAGSGLAGLPGKTGLPGGSISNVTIDSSFIDVGVPANTPSYWLQAGNGGHGTTGGAGGSVQKVIELSSTGVVDIIAGAGGSGSTGAGGAGGSVKILDLQSDSSAYSVHGGKGGTGAPGGAGGSVTGVSFAGNAPSSGIIVSAPFTGSTANDVLIVDSGTGNMVIEQNDGDGSGFTPVVQDGVTGLQTIASVGTTPVAAIAYYPVGQGPGILPDIVVAYKNSSSLGVYINQGSGIFYTENFNTSGGYTGDTLDGTAVTLPFSPFKLAAANFTGDSSEDLAVLANVGAQTDLMTLTGTSAGTFPGTPAITQLPANAVDLTPANIQNKSYSDMFVGFKAGVIESLLANGASTGSPFDVNYSGVTVTGGIRNLDYNGQDGQLLALNGSGTAVTTYTSDTSGALTLSSTISLTQEPGVALVAHFVPEPQTPLEPIEVLSSISHGSQLNVWTSGNTGYTVTSSVQSAEPLKNFVPVIEGTTSGVAALAGSLGHFAFSQSAGPFYDVGLPFNGKSVTIEAGDGGAGFDVGAHGASKGGAGGIVLGMNVVASQISIQGGNGGSSENGPAGAGGLVSELPVLVTPNGQSVQTIIEADSTMLIAGGIGGSASGSAHTATGGAGGAVETLNLSMSAGEIQVGSGSGGNGGGGAGGNGGLIMGLNGIDYAGNLNVRSGGGGSALGATGSGGAGGSILNVTYQLTLQDQTIEQPYNAILVAGSGGGSVSAIGGAGGSIGNVNLKLQPANESVTDSNANPPTLHTDIDSTVQAILTAGNGGNGATGGIGGSLKGLTSTSVFDQVVTIIGATPADTYSFIQINPVTAQLTAGNGGNGSKTTGGAGGSVSAMTLMGITHYDPDIVAPQQPLVITSGNGGNGATAGGAGGAIIGISSMNAQFSASGTGGETLTRTQLAGATIVSGHGGNGGTLNGGAGGTITNLSIGVEGFGQSPQLTTTNSAIVTGGELNIQSGAGGNSATAGKGGIGGAITNSLVGCADAYEQYGLLLHGGAGGNGPNGGGAGASVTNIQLNSPENPSQLQAEPSSNYDILSTLIFAGNGGSATGASGVGGVGGMISQIVESKDVNSSINLLQAGNGGAAIETGGAGGSVTGVKTVGLIGQASDDVDNAFGAFQTYADPSLVGTLFPGSLQGVPQGVFAGRGGGGAVDGMAGSVTSISAAQISAIGAAADANGLFAAAAKVANITAQSIAYDVNGDGLYQNATGTNLTPPNLAVPVDGFIFSQTVPVGVVTANNTVLKGFTFIA